MILKLDIEPSELIRRIPFMKKFKNISDDRKIHLIKEDFNQNKKIMAADELFLFEQVNTFIDFSYMRQQINDNFLFNINIKTQVLFTQPKGMDDLTFKVLQLTNKMTNEKFSLSKEIMSKEKHLSQEQWSQIINEINGVFFKIEDYFTNMSFDVKNPLSENIIKPLIKEHLRRLVEDGYRIAPQDYGAEFRQTGSGKSMTGIPNKLVISDEKLNQVIAQLSLAKEISLKYKRAWEKGEEGIFVQWMGRKMLMRIPKELRTATNPNGKPVDYSNYFNIPNLGDGGFQYKLYPNGNIVGGVVQSRPDMADKPNLGSAVDAGYNKTFDDRIKYFFVKAGIMGKYQEEAGRFASILDTPAIDASIKVRVIFYDEILDFLTKDKGKAQYTSDKKGTEISNQMEFDKKLEKVRKDAEIAIGKPIYGNKTWMDFKDRLKIVFDNPEEQKAMDINQITKEFINLYKSQYPTKTLGKPEVSMSPEEQDAREKEQKEKLARIAAARARMKK